MYRSFVSDDWNSNSQYVRHGRFEATPPTEVIGCNTNGIIVPFLPSVDPECINEWNLDT